MTGGFEAVVHGHYLEALLIDGERVWYTDVVRGGVREVGGDTVLLPERTMIGGLLANADRRLLVSGVGGIVWVDPATGDSGTVIDGLKGVNELRADGGGGVVFGEIDLPAILAGERPGPSSVWRLTPDLTATKLADGLAFANGLAVSPEGDRLYLCESFAAVRAWALAPDGTLGEPLWRIDKTDCDGLALDAAGDLWVTGFASGHLLHLDRDGREVERMPIPGHACTNLRFGDDGTLWLTVVDPAGAEALKVGAMPPAGASTLYRGVSPVVGASLAPAHLRLG